MSTVRIILVPSILSLDNSLGQGHSLVTMEPAADLCTEKDNT